MKPRPAVANGVTVATGLIFVKMVAKASVTPSRNVESGLYRLTVPFVSAAPNGDSVEQQRNFVIMNVKEIVSSPQNLLAPQ